VVSGPGRGATFPERPAYSGSCRGWYQADRQPGAWQYTATCPAGPAVQAACAGGQSHSIHETMILPGPHSCPFPHLSG